MNTEKLEIKTLNKDEIQQTINKNNNKFVFFF